MFTPDNIELLNNLTPENYFNNRPAIIIIKPEINYLKTKLPLENFKLALSTSFETSGKQYSQPLKATKQLQEYNLDNNFLTPKLNKETLYTLALKESSTFSNPAIKFLISGNKQVNQLLKINDHKKYADAILKGEFSDWSKDKNLTNLIKKANDELKSDKLQLTTLRDIEKVVDQYYIIPDETRGIDDQIRVSIDLPEINTDNLKAKLHSQRADDYINCVKHIHRNWQNLVRKTSATSKSTLIPLPNTYVIPGGRFREIYYWDSYFIILGLKRSGLNDLARGMTENFLYMVKEFGFIPNGNRIYYLSRSQPPFLALMVDAVKPDDLTIPENKAWFERAYNIVAYEYQNNWMDPGTHYVPEVGLNRYFDPVDKKRPECFGDDNAKVKVEKGFFLNERSECESGLDFSRRFSHKASHYIPVDLNSLLYKYEKLLEKWAKLLNKQDEAQQWARKAENRKEKMMQYLYNKQDGLFYDYNFQNKTQSGYKYISMIYPLWVGMVDKEIAKPIINEVLKNFEVEGGIIPSMKTENDSDSLKSSSEYQWDYPNGWPPLQLITIESLNQYDHKSDAKRIAEKWLNLNTDMYQKTGKFFEKYNVVDKSIDVKTSYPQQDGFGWTNGVYLELVYTILLEPNLTQSPQDQP